MNIEEKLDTEQYLTLRQEKELFAFDIRHVREILDFIEITKIPNTPDFMIGVINVRGVVVPVVDLRLKLGMTPTEKTMNTRIVVMELGMNGEKTVVGALADSVHEVIELEPEQIEKPPCIGSGRKTELIKGLAKHNEEFIIMLNADQIFSTDEIDIIQEKERNDRDLLPKNGFT